MRLLNARKHSLAQFAVAILFGLVIALTGCANVPKKPNAIAVTQVDSSSPESNTQDVLETKKIEHQASLALIQEFTLEGRIGVQANGRGFSGKMHWQHSNQNNKIDLYSPLGSKVVAIESNAGGVSLTSSDGNTIASSDVESLTEQTVGWRFPAHYLEDWVLGRATDAPIASATWDQSGRLSKLNQDGWEIQYLTYQENGNLQLPSKFNLRNDKLYLKLVIDRWQIQIPDPTISTALKSTKP